MLQLRNISKRFGGVVALNDVSLSLERGEVVALIGENGAGKSTLMKILGGVHQPDSGSIVIDEQPIRLRNVADTVRRGIGFVHQELSNLDNLDVAGNLFLGREPLRGGPLKLVDYRRMSADAVPHLRRLGLQIDPRTLLRTLSIAQQQMVEIAKALSLDARILVLDEPTSSLTAAETESLLDTVHQLREQGVSVIYVSHRLPEVRRIADRVVVLRDGRNAGELGRDRITHENMVRLMIGRDLRSFYASRDTGVRRERTLRLTVRNVRTRTWPTQAVSFDARGGEILGIAGLVGSGRSELAQALFGVEPMLDGELRMDAKPLSIRGPRDAIAAGIYLAPEDRRRTGLIMSMTVRQNITLPQLRARRARLGLIRRGVEARDADAQIKSLRIKTPSRESRVINLSGGNQQKVALAKWLALDPRVLIVDEPTRGIDVGAKAEIYRLLRVLADDGGVAVIVISSDMEEVLGISDRIAVMHEGAIAGTLLPPQYSEQAVLDLAFGRRTRGSLAAIQELA